MEFIAKKGDVLLIGDDDDEMTVHVLETVKYENGNYLKVLAIPSNFQSVIDPTQLVPEYVLEVVEGEDYSIDPVKDQALVDVLDKMVIAKINGETPNLG